MLRIISCFCHLSDVDILSNVKTHPEMHLLIMCFSFATGPGPGRYFLPSTVGFTTHDASKKMEPAYSFGRRLELKLAHSKYSLSYQ